MPVNMAMYPPQGQFGQFTNMEEMNMPQMTKKGSNEMVPPGHPMAFHPQTGMPFEIPGLPIPGMPAPGHLPNQMMVGGQNSQRGGPGMPSMIAPPHVGKGGDMDSTSSMNRLTIVQGSSKRGGNNQIPPGMPYPVRGGIPPHPAEPYHGMSDKSQLAQLEKRLKQLDDEIMASRSNIDKVKEETDDLKKKTNEVKTRCMKEFGDHKPPQVLENKCGHCFKVKKEVNYKAIAFDHFSDILHCEIGVYIRYLSNKIKEWRPKAEKIIEEVTDTIKLKYPEASVNLTGSYYHEYFVPWSNFNFVVVAHDPVQRKLIDPETMLESLVSEFAKKSELLVQIK